MEKCPESYFNSVGHRLIVNCSTLFSSLYQLCGSGQCSYPCFPGVSFMSTPHNNLSKLLADIAHNLRRNTGESAEMADTYGIKSRLCESL